ncbi:MAG: DUF4149 domain-containing protein [Hyphomicrobiaceae bacterium]
MPELAALIAAASLGAMLFFSAVVAPSLFKVYPEVEAGRFLRLVFPHYFQINAALAAIAAIVAASLVPSLILLASAAAMFAVKVYAIPIVNIARDAMLAGDATAAARFALWHRGTVVVNVAEMVALVVAIVLLVF